MTGAARGGQDGPRRVAARAPARAVRTGAFTVVAVALALVAHLLGGGARPSALPLVAATAVLACAATLATGRRLGRFATASALVMAQLGLHTWFSLTGGHGCDVGGLVLTHHHADVACAHGGSVAGGVAGGTTWWLAMPVAHLLAVLATALLLAHGEALLWRLADLAGARLCRLARARGVIIRLARPSAPGWTAPAALGRLLIEPHRGRGPPVAVLTH